MVRVRLVDGGFSTQLATHVGSIIDGDPLWSARFLATDKDMCIRAHRDFVKAGVDILSTGSYQASIDGYKKYLGLEKEEALRLIKESVALARQAVQLESEETGGTLKEISVAGSIGPYGASLHDGSEYRGDYCGKLTKEELEQWHRPKVTALVQAGVDFLAFETLPCSSEAYALIAILKEFPDSKAWISFTIKDSKHISNGELFKDVAEKCWNLASNQLVAIGVNCVHPSLVVPILSTLKESAPHIPLIAYPNSGETYDSEDCTWVLEGSTCTLTEYIEDYLRFGISYIGGCCRTNDKDIRKFAEAIKKWEAEN